jgi:hypothetical protein
MSAMVLRTVMRTVMLAAALSAFAAPTADAREKRVSETGPLMMSGTMVPPAQTRRARVAADKCTPVTIKRRPLGLLSQR